jgi:hypothetical protein
MGDSIFAGGARGSYSKVPAEGWVFAVEPFGIFKVLGSGISLTS